MDDTSARFAESHQQAQQLLPWFVTDQLSEAERAPIAHHLIQCDICRDELETERALQARVGSSAIDVDLAWVQLRRRIEGGKSHGRSRLGGWRRTRKIMLSIVDRPRAAAIIITAQAALLIAMVAVPPTVQPPATFRALGAAPTPARPGNIIVMFGDDLRVADMISRLHESEARIVDGPTSAGAYVLAVPPAKRAAIVTALRRRPGVTMAEPLDP